MNNLYTIAEDICLDGLTDEEMLLRFVVCDEFELLYLDVCLCECKNSEL